MVMLIVVFEVQLSCALLTKGRRITLFYIVAGCMGGFLINWKVDLGRRIEENVTENQWGGRGTVHGIGPYYTQNIMVRMVRM